MALQIPAAIAAFIASQGTRKAVQKYGAQAVDKAKKLIQAAKKPTSTRAPKYGTPEWKKYEKRVMAEIKKEKKARGDELKKSQAEWKKHKKKTMTEVAKEKKARGDELKKSQAEWKKHKKKTMTEIKKEKAEIKMNMGGAVTMKNKCDGAAIKGKTRARMF